MADFDISSLPYLLLGAVATAREESARLAKDLVEKGKGIAPAAREKAKEGAKARDALISKVKEGARARDTLVAKGAQRTDELTEAVLKSLQKVLSQMGLGTQADIEALGKRLDALEKKAAGKPAAVKKAPAKKPAKKS